ncbi:MAG: 3-oxoacyl-ACP reductase FabG, partial [Acidobacteria bacterium]
VVEAIPLRRIATADDVALAVLFLASDWARHITGEILNVNGGSVLCG